MFLSRLFGKRPAPPPPEPVPENYRSEYRIQVPADAPVQVTLRRDGEAPLTTELLDMTIRGLRFRCAEEPPAPLAVDDVAEVVVSTEGVEVLRTPGMLRWRSEDEGDVQWGLEFINLGNLYGQWENYLGQFMNRRSKVRVPVGCSKPLKSQLTFHGIKLRAGVYDLTAKGIGLLVSHVEAACLRMDEPAAVTFKLPQVGEVAGTVILRSRRRIDTRDILGAEFDLSDPEGFARHQEQIAAFCIRREGDLARWGGSWGLSVKGAA